MKSALEWKRDASKRRQHRLPVCGKKNARALDKRNSACEWSCLYQRSADQHPLAVQRERGEEPSICEGQNRGQTNRRKLTPCREPRLGRACAFHNRDSSYRAKVSHESERRTAVRFPRDRLCES